ncbi:MAG: hypothetical protein RJA70_3532 [Pseudomonadota bacterium]|jgi:hypothetical protein
MLAPFVSRVLQVALAAATFGAMACSSEVGSEGDLPVVGAPGPGPGLPNPISSNVVPEVRPEVATLEAFGATDIARLSHAELASSIQYLLGVDIKPQLALLPPDSFTPFDNATTLQSPSTALIEGLNELAGAAATQALQTEEGKARVVGCVPSSATDAVCFNQFLKRMGRRILHRPLSEAEITQLSGLQAADGQDFYVGVRLALQVLLQDVEFIYRVEVGRPTASPDVVQLTPWELGAKLSYLFWGQTPDDELLDVIERGELNTAEQLRAQVSRLLLAPQAGARLTRFHGLWLGYNALPDSELNRAMRAESDALVTRVVMEQRAPWFNLLTASETYVDAKLAEVYGLPPPTQGFAWVPYPDATRRGLLSQGALLANGAKAGETSPTLRGQFILERLLCSGAPPPPPNVAADVPAEGEGGSSCRSARYAAHRREPACASCHSLMDPIGMGLENYDVQGRYRQHDADKPECIIDGQGELPGVGAFRGPAELGQLLADSVQAKHCLSEHVYQFITQRLVDASDTGPLESMANALGSANFSLVDALTEWASNEAFRFRWIHKSEAK